MTRLPRWCVLVVIAPLPSALGAGDWPRFRGPTGQGLYADGDLPLRWSATENVAGTPPPPGEARPPPTAPGARVFLTTATDRGASCRVLCLDRRTGRLLWDREVFRQAPPTKRPENSHATPTPVTDGTGVFTVF